MKTEKKSYVEFQCRMVMVHPTFEHLDWDGGFSIKLHFCRILPFIIHPVQQRGEKNTEIIVGDNFWVTVGMPTGSCQSSSRSHLWKQVFLCGPLAKTYTRTPTHTNTHFTFWEAFYSPLFFSFLNTFEPFCISIFYCYIFFVCDVRCLLGVVLWSLVIYLLDVPTFPYMPRLPPLNHVLFHNIVTEMNKTTPVMKVTATRMHRTETKMSFLVLD